MSVKTSSRASYLTSVIDGTIPKQNREVYDCILQHGPLSNRMIAGIMSLPTASVSARVHGLMQSMLVKKAYHAKCRAPTNRKPKRVRFVKVVWPQKIRQMEMKL